MTPPAPPFTEGWFSPFERVPRKDQRVRVATGHGPTLEAVFTVEHTRDWPSGAAWALVNGHRLVPFVDVVAWSPDPAAATSPFPDGSPAADAPDVAVPDGSAPDGSDPAPPKAPAAPALALETAGEIERTGALLRLLPPDQLDWSPHPDLPTLRTLARRLIRIVARIRWIVEIDTVEASFEPDLPGLESLADIVDTFEASAATTASMTPALTGAALREPWTLERDGEPVLRLARGEALRQYGLRPLVYHQAEIALLLASMGLPVPHPYPLWRFREVPRPRSWSEPEGG